MLIREMTRSEVEDAVAWADREGWEPGLSDAGPFFAADPEGFFTAEIDRRIVATDAENIATDGDGEQDIFVRDLENDTTALVSLNSAGQNIPGGFPSDASISTGGTRVAFAAEDSYHPDDGNVHSDIYVRDVSAGQTLIASRPDGVSNLTGSDASYLPDVSDDGTIVVFESNAGNLTGNSPVQQIVVRDLAANSTTLASRAGGASGAAGGSESRNATISSDGTRVAFHSDSTNLHPDDTTSSGTIFVRDLDADETLLASKAPNGSSADGTSSNAAISGDGTYVAFRSDSNALDPAAADNRPDVFHHDLITGETVLVSRVDGPAGVEGNDSADRPAISEHGRFVAFNSAATNLDPADTDSQGDVYLRDVLGPDTKAPVTTITSGPADGSFTSATSFTFNFTVDEPQATTECRLDGAAFEPCSASFATGGLADGQHTFEVRSSDQAANVENPAVSRKFTVDTSIRGRKVKSAKKQKLEKRKVKVKVTVATGEKATVKLTGSVTRGGGKLKQVKRVAADGKKAKLVAVLKKSKRNRKVAAQIKKGKTVKVKLIVTVTDGVGNSRKTKKTIRLK